MLPFYRALLWLLPASFRKEYGGEMEALFARRLRQTTNPFALCFLFLEAVSDVSVTAAQTHWDILGQDLRYSYRGLRQSPGFALTAILVSAVGVGATTAAYSIVDHVLLRPLPFPQSDRLVRLWEDMSPGSYPRMEPSPANYKDWKESSHSFAGMAASTEYTAGLTTDDQPQQVDGASVSADLFPLLGAQASVGRLFNPADDRPGVPATVVLSDPLWRARFGADPGIVGRRVLLEGQPYIVTGVMQPGFFYPSRLVQFWVPFRFENDAFADRSNNYLLVLGKLRPGVSLNQARSEMRVVSADLKRQYPKDNEHVAVNIEPLRDEVPDRARLMLVALLGASFCVLLIACANLASLLLARALARRKQVAVRAALGAGWERLVRQMLTESLLLALCGGALGILLAAASVPLFSALVPNALPVAANPSINGRVLLFALGLTLLTGIAFGVAPAARAAGSISRDSTASALREDSRQGVGGRKERLRAALVITEVAISFTLLIGAGLLIRALWQLENTYPGFERARVLTARTALPMPRYANTARRVQFYTQVLTKLRRLPGVENAAYSSGLPMVRRGGIWPVTLLGRPQNADRAFHQASLRFVTPGYFDTLRIPLVEGRNFSDSDSPKSQYVALVSQSFVREFWPDRNPLGRQFEFAFSTRTVVGVVGDVRVRGMESPSEPQVYIPPAQVPDESLTPYAPRDLAIRSALPEDQLAAQIRRIVHEADPQLPVADIQTLQDIVDRDTASRRLQTQVLGGFALVAILLAAIGIHGLLSFTVSNRSQEIGVRMAMGATPANVLLMVLRESATLAGSGLLAGALLGYLGGQILSSLLAGIQPNDAAIFTTAAVIVFGVTLAGSVAPAWRAIHIDPISVIRME